MINFAKPGNPGAKFKNHFEKMLKTLSLPKGARDELGIAEDAGILQVASRGGGGGASQTELNPTEGDGDQKRDTTEASRA